ncbi:MAG: signal peptidase II [Balneolaceae bacterium]|nr:signal peptidase II [Balneolaceae bacterium]
MSRKEKKLTALFTPVFLTIILDQITKYLVRTNPDLHYEVLIEGWLAINFTKNPGMALGMDWLSTPVISVIAITATIGILTYVLATLKRATISYLICMGLILGGALGNIMDRIFMGLVGGYGGVLEGHVVDFIHFTLTIGDTPVFPYIFNVADMAISTSIIILILFHKWIMPVEEEGREEPQPESSEEYDLEAKQYASDNNTEN